MSKRPTAEKKLLAAKEVIIDLLNKDGGRVVSHKRVETLCPKARWASLCEQMVNEVDWIECVRGSLQVKGYDR